MTSRIIVAIVAIVAAVLSLAAPVAVVGVLSLAAPVAVEAQTPTPTLTVDVNMVYTTVLNYSGFTPGSYHIGICSRPSTLPTSCNFTTPSPVGPRDRTAGGDGVCRAQPQTFSTSGMAWGTTGFAPSPADARLRHQRTAAYSDATCQTEVAGVSFTRPPVWIPTWSARGITEDSATIYIQEPFLTHGILDWDAKLTPGGSCTRVSKARNSAVWPDPRTDGETWTWSTLSQAESPTPRLTGLSAGTTYTYSIYDYCSDTYDWEPVASVTFTTLVGAPPPPDTPTGVEATTDGSGSVTLSWANPGDPDIASYEYYLQRAGGPAGEWRTVAGSNADTTSVTIDLTTGEAVAGNARGVSPMVEWTIYLRARGVNGSASRATSTVVSTVAGGGGTVVPALPLAGLATLALLLFLGGKRRRNG